MADFEKEKFVFPDEKEIEKVEIEKEAPTEIHIDIEDDTPEEDRGRQPIPKEMIEKIENDELEEYTEKQTLAMAQLKKGYHDERREKERALREHQEAIAAAKLLFEENQKMKKMISSGEKEYLEAMKDSRKLKLKMAKKAYKEAIESGDTDAIMDAQQAITEATMALDKVKNFKLPPLQEQQFEVKSNYEQAAPQKPDTKAISWQQRNSWFGQDEEMTASALGLHEKLKKQGVVVGSDEYYDALDRTIRKRFPENFEEEVQAAPAKDQNPKQKASTVVAPATRSTSSKRVRLTTSQVAIAKKLGITPEQYVRELLRQEA